MIPKLLPQFIENKLLYIGTIRQLPDGVDIESVLSQAATEFNENVLPKMMEQEKVVSGLQFDALLRLQGSSLRKLRRSWSEEQLTSRRERPTLGPI